MSIVSIRKVANYDPARVAAAIAAHFEALGVEKDVRPGMKLLLKPNLLTGRGPEQAVTTHPAVIRAVAEWFRARGVTDIVLADSPGGPYSAAMLNRIYRACGLTALSDVVVLNQDTASQEIKAAPGSTHQSFQIINPIVEADYIVNLAKMKTHGMTTVSLGIKNMFGAIPGLMKPQKHFENPSHEGFGRMLVALAQTTKPNITLIDGILAMEGDGPSGGTVREAGLLFASRDVFAQDYVVCGLMGVKPERAPMIKAALDRGLIDVAGIELVGDRVSACEPPFALPEATRRVDFLSHAPKFLQAPLGRWVDAHVKPVPVVRLDGCVGCGKCAESCPQGIVEIVDKKAVIRTRRCISCFCCQEMCPAKAIEVEHKLKLR